MEAFLGNKESFLTQDQWQQVLRLAVFSDDSLTSQKSLTFTLWSYLIHGPKLFKETTDVICSSYAPEDVVEDLIQRLIKCRIGLLQWLDAAHQLENGEPVRHEEMHTSPHWILEDSLNTGDILQLTLRGTFTMCFILKTRLLYALAPSRFQELEVECQRLAQKIVSSQQHQGENQITWTSFMSQSAWIAKGILATKRSWGEGCTQRDGLIDRWKFEAWCKAIGRKCP
jgi:hypothetical protein